MNDRHWYSAFRGTSWILREHGLFTWAFCWVTGLLSLASVSHWARWLPNTLPVFGNTHDPGSGKTKAIVLDSAALLVFILTPVAVRLSWSDSWGLAKAGACLSLYLIYDSVIRHIRVMWFDDLEPGTPRIRRKVWSHRRILFLAIASYGLSIFLFTSLLHRIEVLGDYPYGALLERSFQTATLMSLPKSLSPVDVAQIIVSLFYLAIVVATTASIAYQRREVATDD